MLRKQTALISHLLHIPFPEHLPDEEFEEKYQQAIWILKNVYRRNV